MAGIGFELRKILKRDSLLSLMQAYSYAALISSGPWIMSIVGILIIGVMSYAVIVPKQVIVQFQVSITYVISLSLVLTGIFQLALTRFSADRLFEKQHDAILPNFHSVSFAVTAAGGVLGLLCVVLLFPEQSLLYRLLLLACFVIMCNIWIATIFLSGMKQYQAIFWIYALGYAITVLAALALRSWGLEGLMAGFALGQAVLLMAMMALILRNFGSDRFISFEFFQRERLYPSLMAIGFLYNLAIWIDKAMFWFTPETSQAIIGPLRASVIYDLPVFLAYLAIIPGMAIFLLRMETDFVEDYDAFYDAVRGGASLETIEKHRNGMVQTIRLGLSEIIKIQAIATLLLIVTGEAILNWLGISTLYLPLLYIDVIAASLQVVLLGILNVFFYLDKRRIVLGLCATFVVLNVALTWLSIQLGPTFYGFGFALAVLVVVLAGALLLARKLELLEYETFMLQ
ncbi:exopolysaccharide Pel transporter PelG [Herbaspirillum sp. alder98]|uniref:exopolysaccharide Pel transporter PelG n=1 Tax=Herbaspirillum sp. alder98 TaxID=2913096 RepID=UPI001CD8574A|nr:exopolysaccharide Pel transporter PelG [Herbaspirillum sp. alder98]MCA1324228.1 exopolysaccharide Pel transporter PelG [Herbaspirillum sp. alder98]